jgi:hypothetical protein
MVFRFIFSIESGIWREMVAPGGLTRFCTKGVFIILVPLRLPVDLTGDFVLMSNYTGKEVVE